MATLQKIRNNAGLLVSIVIGLALLAFILGDLFRSGSKLFAKSRSEVAEISGKSVGIQMFQGKIDENIENYKRNTGQNSVDESTRDRLRDQTWEQLVREYLMVDKYDDLGIAISGEELFDLVQGNNIDPQIMQIPIFKNQQTGQFDRNLVVQFLRNMELDPSGKAQSTWSAFEKAFVEQKEDQKYNTLIEKGLFVTDLQAKDESTDKNLKVDFDYVDVKYNTVSDSSVSFTQDDLQKYYKAHESDFQQDESREINYVTFPVIASAEDEKQTKEWVDNLAKEFSTIENNEQYVNLNSDIPFDANYYSKSELSDSIKPLYDAEVGTIYGTYKENNAYKLSKVVDFKHIPDSVNARHILIRTDKGVNADAKADSLMAVIKKGGNFAELAKEYSADGSASQGGDLGWFKSGVMVKPFNDACFFGNKGDLVKVTTQFGVHIIEIMDQSAKTRKVQIATIARTIEPSTKTYQAAYAAASKFGASNRTFEAFRDAADKESINIKTANVKRNDRNLANFENPRQIIRWAYEADKGQVSEIFEIGDMFVIAAVKSVQEKGTAPFADVSLDIEREVRKEKKAEYITNEFNKAKENASTIQLLADRLNTVSKEAKNVSFAAYSIPGLGYEPEVQAAAVESPVDQISEPIKGKSGVFVIQVKNIQKPAENSSYANDMNYLTRSYQSRVNYQVYEAIKEAAKIKDNRSNFY